MTEDHGEALEYDLLTRTHFTLNDIGGALPWSSLNSFITNLKSDSALARDLNKSTGWEDVLTTNRILADIYDLLQMINANLCNFASGGKAKKKKIKPYPRPDRDNDNKHKIGKGAMPLNDLYKWIRSRQHGR